MHISTRLPKQIELGALHRTSMELEVVRMDSGHEDRVRLWEQFLREYEVTYPISQRNTANFITVYNAALATGLGEHSFELWDWRDYQVEEQTFGEGDGVDTTFQLSKSYTFGTLTHGRRIQRPVLDDGLVDEFEFEIQADGTPVAEADYTVSNLGIVTFDVAPLAGVILSWTGEFNVPVRFDKIIQSTGVATHLEKYDTFPLLEVRLKAEDFA